MIINNQLPGSKYTESGKIDILRFILFLVIGYLISSLAGIGYGLLSDLNPIIYLNFILLGIALFAVILAVTLFRMSGKLRNRYVAIVLSLFFGVVCIYNAWTAVYTGPGESVFDGIYFNRSIPVLIELISFRSLNIGHFGTDGAGLGTGITSVIYAVELLILVLVPAIYIGKDPSYYCEECAQSMKETEHFFGFNPDESPTLQSDVKAGKLKNLFEHTAYAQKELKMGLKYIHCTINECPECQQLVYSADLGNPDMEKNKMAFKKEASLAVNLFGRKTN
jgi:hypothetical protein